MAAIPAALFSAEFIANPHPTFDYLRQHAPVCFVESINTWAITRYEDAVQAMRDRRLTRAHPDDQVIDERIPLLAGFQANALAYADHEDHTRIRTILHKGFSPHIVALQRSVPVMVTMLLDGIAGRSEIDFVSDFADPLPAWLIAELIGISASEWPHVQHWSHTLKRGLGRNATPDAKMEANHALEEFRDTILALLAERRGQPQTDLLSTVMELADQGEALSEAEIVSNCLLMLIAGHEAVTSLLVNGVLALLEHPDQLEHLRLNPALYPSALEEIARYGHPMQMIPRYVSQDVELGGQPLKQGQTVIVFLGAANYDPEVFSDPRQFDISRSPNPHLGYGYGAQYCFGAPLARLASPLALQQFLERYPTVRLAPTPPAYLELLQDMVIRELRLTL